MSSSKTTNYGLHLWEPGDDFLRSEFNENNEAVDTAIQAVVDRLSPVRLLEVVTQTSAQQISLDLSNIDWSAWDHLLIRTRLATEDLDTSASIVTSTDRVLINGSVGSDYHCDIHPNDQTQLAYYLDRNGTDSYQSSGYTRTAQYTGYGRIFLKLLDEATLYANVKSFFRVYGYQNGVERMECDTIYRGEFPIETLDFLGSGLQYAAGSQIEVWGVR